MLGWGFLLPVTLCGGGNDHEGATLQGAICVHHGRVRVAQFPTARQAHAWADTQLEHFFRMNISLPAGTPIAEFYVNGQLDDVLEA